MLHQSLCNVQDTLSTQRRTPVSKRRDLCLRYIQLRILHDKKLQGIYSHRSMPQLDKSQHRCTVPRQRRRLRTLDQPHPEIEPGTLLQEGQLADPGVFLQTPDFPFVANTLPEGAEGGQDAPLSTTTAQAEVHAQRQEPLGGDQACQAAVHIQSQETLGGDTNRLQEVGDISIEPEVLRAIALLRSKGYKVDRSEKGAIGESTALHVWEGSGSHTSCITMLHLGKPSGSRLSTRSPRNR
eukprot:6479889-Amphidinium_carterae.1